MSEKKIVILGAGGHGRVVAEIAQLSGYTEICFLDDNTENELCHISGKISDYTKYLDDYDFFVAIGNNEIRKRMYEELFNVKAGIATLIHPNSVISKDVKIGKGSAVMAGAIINTNVVIGNGSIINTSSSVDHDCKIGNYTHISVGAHVAGTVEIGECVFVGAGVTIINDIKICNDCLIGAGAVVVKNIDKQGKYKGVPAKLSGGKNSL